MIRIVTFMFLFFNGLIQAQDHLGDFQNGNTHYNNGEYQEAIDKFNSILNDGLHSFELYFNLANAHYKQNNIAESIYFYEKALQFDANNKEALSNLSFAQQMTIDDIDVVPNSGIKNILNGLVSVMNSDGWGVLIVVLIWLTVLFLLVYFFSRNTKTKRVSFVLSFTLSSLILLSFVMGFYAKSLENNNIYAIVFDEEVQVKEEPNLRSSLRFKLHEGTKILLLETLGEWNKIRLTNGQSGWLQSESIKVL